MIWAIQSCQALPRNDFGPEYGLHDAQPFAYDRKFDLAQQKVIFNPDRKSVV